MRSLVNFMSALIKLMIDLMIFTSVLTMPDFALMIFDIALMVFMSWLMKLMRALMEFMSTLMKSMSELMMSDIPFVEVASVLITRGIERCAKTITPEAA